MRKCALFAFQGDPTCFVHVLLNALDLRGKGNEVKIIIEGAATGLVPQLAREGNPLNPLYRRVKAQDLVAGACKACSQKTGVLAEVEAQGLPLLGDMSGHPSMGFYLDSGYEIITF